MITNNHKRLESLCEEYGVELIYSKDLQVYLLVWRDLTGKSKSTPLTLEALQDFSDQQVEIFVAKIALTRLMTE